MLRGGPQVSAQDNSKQQQQKQKKRLSFKDPEVEGPLRNHFFAGCKSKTLGKPTKTTNLKKTSLSVEDLTLEDQALQIAQHVNDAFSDLSMPENDQVEISDFDSISADFERERERETEIRDSSPSDFASCERSCQLLSFKISADDQEFLDDLVPPLLDSKMRGPSLESSDPNSSRNCIPAEPSMQVRPSTSTQHQVQLLRYQLEQQNQQTQMAMHQVKLLQDRVDAESEARQRAQEQNNQLMQQNKELLSHMKKLFQQIEDLEKQIQLLEQEKRGKQPMASPENQVTSLRRPTTWAASRKQNNEQVNDKPAARITSRRPGSEQVEEKPTTWTTGRRLSSEQVNETPTVWGRTRQPSSEQVNEKPTIWSTSRRPSSEQVSEKPTLQNRSQYTSARKGSLTSSKPLSATPRTPTVKNSTSVLATRKLPSYSSRPLSTESQNKDSGTKEKATLRIGDTSPPVQSGTASPFSSVWKLKTPDTNTQSNPDQTLGYVARSRTGSFSSYTKRPQEEETAKSTLFGSNNNLSITSITGKKYSSSTSDLYNTPSTIQGKSSLMIEEPSTSVKSAVSNLNISISKLPRYQPYTGWRRASLTNESEQSVSAIGKDTYKNPQKTSLFNR